jgi:UDP-N-acetylglucosamine 2-epimerase
MYSLNYIRSTKAIMSREILGKEQKEKHICWRCNKLKFLGFESKAKTELGDSGGLGALAESLKWIMNDKYEVDYSVNVKEEFLNRRNPLSKLVVEGTFKE